MPCFSASDRRSTHQFSQVPTSRAKTAAHQARSDIRLPGYATKKESTYNPCTDVFYTQGLTAKVPKRNRGREDHKVSIPMHELERLKTASKVITLEDRLDALMKREEESKRLEHEAEEAKHRFKEMDDALKRAETERLKGNEAEEGNENEKVLERAFLAKYEQEPEVKRANRVFLDAKTHAVRDAQVQEKKDLRRAMRSDEQRLERQVIDLAIKALNDEDERQQKDYLVKQKYAQDIKKQLHDQETLRFLEAERVEEEAAQMNKAYEALKREEARRMQEAHENRLKYREDLGKVVAMCREFRRMLWEQEQECEMRVAAYMRDRDARLKELHRQKMLAKEEFERKQARIYSVAEKILLSKSDREEMAYLRELEKNEREYRQKEREAALRKKQIERDMTAARERQMQETKHRQALQIARAEEEFNALIERIKQDDAKDRKEREEREKRRQVYRRDIMEQMGNKEMERRRLKEVDRVQAEAWRESERQRDANIRAVIYAKLASMREACLPEKYIREVESQLARIVGPRRRISASH